MVIEPRPRRARRAKFPDLSEAASAISNNVMSAAHVASEQLRTLGIAHAIIGGIAVGAHGAPRATKDVDFLVHQHEAFHGNLILSFAPGVPIAVGDIVIDYLTPEGTPWSGILSDCIASAVVTGGIPVIGLEPLVLMKLHAGRRRDLDDVQRLLDQGDLFARVRGYLEEVAPELLEKLRVATDG